MTAKRSVVALGEVLWDVFPDGAKFGGAPANFACSMAGISRGFANVSLVSSVGPDELGTKALQELVKRNVDIAHVPVAPRPTGRVLIELNANGEAAYEFLADTAWDNIAWTSDLQQLARSADVICFGTLGQREAVSRNTIQRFARSVPDRCVRVFDINLRPPYYSDEIVLSSLELADILKLNEDELPYVADLIGISGSSDAMLEAIAAKYQLAMVAYTRGANGATLFRSGELSRHKSVNVEVIDTVGAGDAFTAAIVRGVLEGWPLDQINQVACRVAAWVCSQAGATPENWDLPEFS